MVREEVLRQAGDLISGDRHTDYGSAYDNHMRIARIWSVVLQQDITPEQVAACMIGVKLARLVNDNTKADSWVDIAGYAALGSEMAGAQ